MVWYIIFPGILWRTLPTCWWILLNPWWWGNNGGISGYDKLWGQEQSSHYPCRQPPILLIWKAIRIAKGTRKASVLLSPYQSSPMQGDARGCLHALQKCRLNLDFGTASDCMLWWHLCAFLSLSTLPLSLLPSIAPSHQQMRTQPACSGSSHRPEVWSHLWASIDNWMIA